MSSHLQLMDGKPDMLYSHADRRSSDLSGFFKRAIGHKNIQKVDLYENGLNEVVKHLKDSFYKFGNYVTRS